MPGKFTVYKDKANKFRFNLKATNGEIIAASESYPDKKSALKGIASIVKNAPVAKIVDTTLEEEPPKPSRGRKPQSKLQGKPQSKTQSKPRRKRSPSKPSV